jgi:hypothetical protein
MCRQRKQVDIYSNWSALSNDDAPAPPRAVRRQPN